MVASACQGTEALKALVARASKGAEALKAEMASACQGTEALRMDSHRNWSKAETRVGRLEADMQASRVARQKNRPIWHKCISGRLNWSKGPCNFRQRHCARPKRPHILPLKPKIGRDDIDGLAAHVLGKIQAQVAEEVGACAR